MNKLKLRRLYRLFFRTPCKNYLAAILENIQAKTLSEYRLYSASRGHVVLRLNHEATVGCFDLTHNRMLKSKNHYSVNTVI